MAGWRYEYWRPYVPVARRRAQAARRVAKLVKSGRKAEPVRIEGRTIAHTFWGKAWCENLERYSDFENRLPRGRTYVRNGSVIDLKVSKGVVEALVSGSEIYETRVELSPADRKQWEALKAACSGRIDSVVELLQGRFSDGVMQVLTARESGLFPAPDEIEMSCSCPDSAVMCKHVAAVLYGVGARLDTRPELLFVLRGVNHTELITEAAGAALVGEDAGAAAAMGRDEMSKLFGIELESEHAAAASAGERTPAAPVRKKAGRRPNDGPRGGYYSKLESLDARLPRLREHFVQEDMLTNAGYRALFSVPGKVATLELKRLAERRILIRRGKKRGAHYLAGVEMW